MIFSHVLYQLSYPATRNPARVRLVSATLLIAAPRRNTPHLQQYPSASYGSEAGATGLEPATSDVTGRRSNQLNYARNKSPTARGEI